MYNEYQNKATGYFSATRFDIQPAIPFFSESVLEIGCGTGATLAWLKDSGRCKSTSGIELVAQQAEIAEKVVDRVIQGSVDDIDLASWTEHFDLILCLDVLEHLNDPWGLVGKLHGLLKPGGRLVASIPNIRHISVLVPLLFRGEWVYKERGILDKTHLRFFTRKSAIELATCSGLTLISVHELGLKNKSISSKANKITLGMFRDFFAAQYLVAVENRVHQSQQK
ncbi:MAG: class I SAM-dependent methyltransferase [Thiobacillus sp.]